MIGVGRHLHGEVPETADTVSKIPNAVTGNEEKN